MGKWSLSNDFWLSGYDAQHSQVEGVQMDTKIEETEKEEGQKEHKDEDEKRREEGEAGEEAGEGV